MTDEAGSGIIPGRNMKTQYGTINRQRKILIALTIFLLYNGVVHEIIMGELFRG